MEFVLRVHSGHSWSYDIRTIAQVFGNSVVIYQERVLFFTSPADTVIDTLTLHDALPIYGTN